MRVFSICFPASSVVHVPTACSGGNHGDVYVALGRAPVGVGPLEVRFAHPVRLSPDTHSQGHGRPCLQRLHPRRGFSATWTLLMVISIICSSPCALKRFPRTSWRKNVMSCVKWPDLLTTCRIFFGISDRACSRTMRGGMENKKSPYFR